MPSDFAYDVFLSYNRAADKARVRRLAERLRAAGLRVWLDDWVVRAGEDLNIAIEHGLEASRTFVLCMSPQALASDWVRMERSSVQFRDPANHERRFVPLLLTDCELPTSLRRLKYVDFRVETAESFAELLTACRSDGQDARPERRSPQTPTAVPGTDPTPAPVAVLERTLHGHKSSVVSLAPSPDGRWLASGSIDETIKVWNLDFGVCGATLPVPSYPRTVVFTADGRRIAAGDDKGSVSVWDPGPAAKLFKLRPHKGPVFASLALADGDRILTVSRDGKLQICKSRNAGFSVYTLLGREPLFSVDLSRDEKRAIVGLEDGRLRFWDLEASSLRRTLEGHTAAVMSVRLSKDERFAVSGSADGSIRLWDLEIGVCVNVLESHDAGVDIALSPDGNVLASACWGNGAAKLWNWKEGACFQVLPEAAGTARIAFSPDGTRLFASQLDEPFGILVFRLTTPET